MTSPTLSLNEGVSSPRLPGPNSRASIAKAAEDFEANFASEFLGHIFSSIEADPLCGGGEGENIYRSFLLQEYGKNLARTGALGISDLVRKELLYLQEQEK